MTYTQWALQAMGERYQIAKAAGDPRAAELCFRLAQLLGLPAPLVDFEIELRVQGVVGWHQ